MPKAKKTKLPLFDIRVHAVDKDTILLKGAPTEASPTMLSGVIALSATEPLQVKRMKLKLYATLNFRWEEKYHNPKGQIFSHPYKFTKMVYCFDWDPINLERFLHTHDPLHSSFIASRNTSSNSLENMNQNIGFTTGTLTRSNPGSASNLQRIGSNATLTSKGSTTSISGLAAQQKQSQKHSHQPSNHTRTKSSSSLSAINLSSLTSLGTSSSGDFVTLEPGNYEFPFQVILDGSIPESIVSHPCCSLVYRLQCSIERGRFSTPIHSRKLLHVVRTLSPDNAELSETIAVDNTWPEKIDYSISVPTKAIAIGSTCQIFLDMAPLCKGLKLGSIKIKLLEYASFSTATGQHTEERTLTTKHIPKIVSNSDGVDIWSDEAPTDEEGVFYRGHNIFLSQDKWNVKTSIQLPPSLEKMTQDLDISSMCKVRHKLKFSVGLINPDGHVSELRATLPITLFISPFVPIKVKTIDAYDDPFLHSVFEDASNNVQSDNIIFQHEDVNLKALYQRLHQNDTLDTNVENLVPTPNMNTQDFMAPPNYDDRIYDRVYDLDSHLNQSDDPVTAAGGRASELPTIPTSPSQQSRCNVISDINAGVKSGVADKDAGEEDDEGKEKEEGDKEDGGDEEEDEEEGEDVDDTVNSCDFDPFADNTEAKAQKKYLRKYKKPVFSIAGDDDDDNPDILDPFDTNTPNLSPYHPDVHGRQENIIPGPAFDSGERMPISQFPSSNHLISPGALSPVQHLSRATSFIGDTAGSLPLSSSLSSMSHNSTMDEKVLKKMFNPPSYEIAIHSNASLKDLTPVYDPPPNDLRSNLHIIDSRLRNLRLTGLDQHPHQHRHQQSAPAMSKNSKSTTALNLANKRQSYGLTILSHGHYQSNTPPSLSRNVSNNSLLSKMMSKTGTSVEDHMIQHTIRSITPRFELGSPGNRSVVSTPGVMPDGYFSSQDGSSYFSAVNSSPNPNSNIAMGLMISQPKAAHVLGDTTVEMMNENKLGKSTTGLHINLRPHFS